MSARPEKTRLSNEQALELLRSRDLIALGARADAMRRELHPDGRVTYIVDRNINYTDGCVSCCRFCAFWRDPAEAYVLSEDELAAKIEYTLALGGRQILLQGGLHPDLRIDFYERMLRFIKARFDVHIHGFSPPEIVHIAEASGLEIPATLERLRAAGLDTVPGGGAEILVERVRAQVSPGKCTAAQWLDVMRRAHRMGIRSTATMMFGHVETLQDRVEHLDAIRTLQDETGGFTAFIPWTFQPRNTALVGVRAAGAFAYLKTLAVSRLYLDNVENIQASWVTQGARVGQTALRFGANDMGGTMIEENVVRAAGVEFRMDADGLERIIRDAGFTPRRRDCYYNLL